MDTHTRTWIEYNEPESAHGIAADIEALSDTEEARWWRDKDNVSAYLNTHGMGKLTKYRVTIKVEEEKE